jgi:hypothetical protein
MSSSSVSSTSWPRTLSLRFGGACGSGLGFRLRFDLRLRGGARRAAIFLGKVGLGRLGGDILILIGGGGIAIGADLADDLVAGIDAKPQLRPRRLGRGALWRTAL